MLEWLVNIVIKVVDKEERATASWKASRNIIAAGIGLLIPAVCGIWSAGMLIGLGIVCCAVGALVARLGGNPVTNYPAMAGTLFLGAALLGFIGISPLLPFVVLVALLTALYMEDQPEPVTA